jgi:hypothetical protein
VLRTITAFCVPKSKPTTDIFWQSFSKFQGCAQRCLLLVQTALFDGVVVGVGVCGGGGVCMCVGAVGRCVRAYQRIFTWWGVIVEVTLRVHPALALFLGGRAGATKFQAVIRKMREKMREDPRKISTPPTLHTNESLARRLGTSSQLFR